MRIVPRIILSLVLGAVTTVMLAWACAGARMMPNDAVAQTAAVRGGGEAWPFEVPSEWGKWALRASRSGLGFERVVCTGLRTAGTQLLAERVRAGLPFASMEARVRGTWTRAQEDLTTLGLRAIGAREEVVLPVLPMPAGFAADTLIFALVAFALLGPVRIKRAACTTCPECGGRGAARSRLVLLLGCVALAAAFTVAISWSRALGGRGLSTSPVPTAFAASSGSTVFGIHKYRGWPFGAMVSTREFGPMSESAVSVARGVLVKPATATLEAVYLPLKPRPLEFAVNTTLCTLVLALCAGLFVRARRAWRDRRERCEHCGYSLAGLPGPG